MQDAPSHPSADTAVTVTSTPVPGQISIQARNR